MSNKNSNIDNSVIDETSTGNLFEERKNIQSLISENGDETYWVIVTPKQVQHNSDIDFKKQTIIERFLHHPDSPSYQLLLHLNGQYIHINNQMFDGNLCTFVETFYKD